MASFVHLRVKSAYSLLEGAVRPKELADLAREAGTPAVAVTDTNNLFGVYEISDTLTKAGIQPIVGALLSVEFQPPRAAPHRPAQEAAACRPAGPERDGLSESHQAAVGRLSGGGAGRLAACEGRKALRPCRGADRS